MGRGRTIFGAPPKSNRLPESALRDRGAAWCEAGLDGAAFALFPLLALDARGVAVLAGIAGVCAAGLTAIRRPLRLGGLGRPAILLGLLVGWGALSAAWSLDPVRSLLLAAHLAGLALCGLALAAAAARIAYPQRVPACLLAGIGLGIVVAAADVATGGAAYRLIHARTYTPTELNQVAVALAILLFPTAAALFCRGRRIPALIAAIIMAAAVALLLDSTAKLGLAIGVPVAALVYWRRRATGALAALSMLAVIAAPAALPRLAQVPGLLQAAQPFKISVWHRLLIWSFVGDRIADHPVLGWGLDASRAIPGGTVEIGYGLTWLPLHPHDAALQVWLELGAPGAILFALFFGLLWYRLGDADWPRVYAAAAAGSFAAALTVASASYGIWQEWWLGTLALALFLVLAMGRAARPP